MKENAHPYIYPQLLKAFRYSKVVSRIQPKFPVPKHQRDYLKVRGSGVGSILKRLP